MFKSPMITAMRLLRFLYQEPDKSRFISAMELKEKLFLSYSTTIKMATSLTNAGFLESRPGNLGGFRITQRAEYAKVSDLAAAINCTEHKDFPAVSTMLLPQLFAEKANVSLEEPLKFPIITTTLL